MPMDLVRNQYLSRLRIVFILPQDHDANLVVDITVSFSGGCDRLKTSSVSDHGVAESISRPSSSSIRQVRPCRCFLALIFEVELELLLLPKKRKKSKFFIGVSEKLRGKHLPRVRQQESLIRQERCVLKMAFFPCCNTVRQKRTLKISTATAQDAPFPGVRHFQ